MASIKDVAQLAGVSFSTVSIIVNGKAAERKISAETQQRVLDAMRQLQYRPNIAAKKLKEGDKDKLVVALFWTFDFRRAMLARFLSELLKRVQESDTQIEIVVYPYTNRELYKEQALLQGNQFHVAIIANASDEDMEYLESIQSMVPIVLYNRLSDKYSSVNILDEEIGRKAAEHLYEQGYRHPLIVTSETKFAGMAGRESSFVDRMAELGGVLLPEPLVAADNSVEGGVELGQELLKGGLLEQTDALYCASDALALGLVHSLTEAGIRVPEQVAVLAVGNGNPHYSAYSNPPLTVVNVPMEEMARGCIDLVEKALHANEYKAERLYYDTELFARKSTRKKGE